METRYCPRCVTHKPVVDFRRNSKTGAFSPYCKLCTKAYKAEQYAKNPQVRQKALDAAKRRAELKSAEIKAYQTAYREAHREEARVRAAEYRKENKDEINAKRIGRIETPAQVERRKQQRSERLATDCAYRNVLNERGRVASRKYYRKNKKSVLETAKEKYWADPARARAITRISVVKWNARHPEKVSAIRSRRKAVRKGARAAGFDDEAHYKFLEIWQQGRCYHCGIAIAKPAYQRDHLVAIERNGAHSADNLCLSCGRCNNSKNDNILWQQWTPPLLYPPPLMFIEDKIRVISTFAASDQWQDDAMSVMPTLKAQQPDKPLFFDWEWLTRRSVVDNMLSARDGSAIVVQARKTQSVEVNSEMARDFLDQYHLQGFGRGTIYTGLTYEDGLVAVAAWLEVSGAVELNRLAFKGRVIGGFGKLLAAFSESFLPDGMPILSYLDPRYGDGHGYEAVGFNYAGETVGPTYYYVGPGGMFHRRSFTRDAMKATLVLYDEKLSERENARMNGYYRVYGLKQKRYMWRKK